MRILLDECLPRRLKQMFTGHEAITVQERGWTGTKNGVLLRLAELEFDVFTTTDQNLTSQQNLKSTILLIVVLVARTNRFEELRGLMPQVTALLQTNRSGEVVHIRRLG